MVCCAYEDRPHYLPGLQLLAHSLASTCPGQPLVIWCPEAHLGAFRTHLPGAGVSLRVWPHAGISGWSVKPTVLLEMLDEGHDEVVWMDSDVLVTAEFRDRLEQSDAIVLASEPRWASQVDRVSRADAWKLSVARSFPDLINSCVTRVKPLHRPLLEEWQLRLTHDEYLRAQRMPFADRPAHVRGDQDVLHALLTSSLFARIPVSFLRQGTDIAQCHMADGYTVIQRLRHAWRSLPPLIHCQGFKPWDAPAPRPLFLEVSSYTLAAGRYRALLSGETSWLAASSRTAKALRFLLRDEPNVTGLAPALAAQLQRGLRLRTRLNVLTRQSHGRSQLDS